MTYQISCSRPKLLQLAWNSLLIFSIWLLSNNSTISCHHDNERAALLNFKSQLADPSNQLSSWQGLNCCSWHGILCSDDLHVISVDLRNPNPDSFFINMMSELIRTSNSTSSALTGIISSSLFTLSHISYLDLSFNNFRFSRIPPGIENLTTLTYLNLSNAMFSDSITTQFSNLTSLKALDLSCSMPVTDFSAISYSLSTQISMEAGTEYAYISNGYLSSSNLDWLKGLDNLEDLSLTGVDLSESLKSSTQWANPISGLFNLRWLQLSNCMILGEVPVDQLLNLTRLSYLKMDFNSFTSQIPARLANMTSLLSLDFTNSNLRGLAPPLPQLTAFGLRRNNITVDLGSMFAVHWPHLKIFDISSTQVIGTIPPSFANTTSLIDFRAINCFIQGHFPSSMTNLSRLEILFLDINQLIGQLPSSISNLKNLEFLSLMQNSLDGSIPDSICNISSLRYLALAFNSFSGEIPDCMTNFPNLQILYLSINSFTGKIQSLPSFFKTSNPYLIGLGNNKLTVKLDQWPFPSSFQPSFLDLSSCNISGSIPSFLSNLTEIYFLDLSENNLSGVIPSWLFNLPKLGYLDLSFNKFQGFLPSEIQLTSNFAPTTLNLASNLLEGPIPSIFENIDAINLSGNNFTGQIPPSIALENAKYISFSGNKLVGKIPFSFCLQNNALMLLDVSNNSFSGALPVGLGNCTSLRYLNVAENNFSGSVPAVIGNANSLSYLDLTANHFEGSFPSFIGKLQNLVVLKMGYNQFVGKIPQFVGNLQKLRILTLKFNLFNGTIPEEINKLEKLQIMDLSNNKLIGPIPEKLDGLKTLINRPMDGYLLGYIIAAMYAGVEFSLAYKGLIYQFVVVRTFNSGIDVSVNALTGNIPQEITLLKGLAMLNLSHNALSGEIPSNIGDMTGLQSFDLSFNNLAGTIPISINSLDSLGVMNLSYNNLSGKIPPGTRFDTLYYDGWTYIGNKYLCGVPLAIINCNINSSFQETATAKENDTRQRLLFIGVVVLGFIVGFWGYFGVVNLNEQWRERYWITIDNITSRIINSI